ncbi:hypothetical protein IJS18_01935 [Candidatus Saccharibacteria bacterium]|nr:hypothetical protein [Candidatus Saccharibacteria bacterium]
MLVQASRLIGTKVLSMQSTSAVGSVSKPIVDPSDCKVIGFFLSGSMVDRGANILDTKSIREYSRYGMVIDSINELVNRDDVIKISKVLELNFDLVGLKVETKKGTKLGKVVDYTVTSEDYMVQQIIVKRPIMKSFVDPELTIPRKEILEITDFKIIVKDEESVIKKKAANEDFIPNFVNPFRKTERDFAQSQSEIPDDKDTE